VRLIGIDGKQRGIFSFDEAIKIAENENFDLILVNANQNPIVVKLGNYGAYVYQKEKKERKLRKSQKETKEVRIGFREAEYDLKRKANLVKKFLSEGHQVQVRLFLKGREKMFTDLAEEKLKNFLNLVSELVNYKITQPLKKTPNFLSIILSSS
jgi:translation initiation factor IF-3